MPLLCFQFLKTSTLLKYHTQRKRFLTLCTDTSSALSPIPALGCSLSKGNMDKTTRINLGPFSRLVSVNVFTLIHLHLLCVFSHSSPLLGHAETHLPSKTLAILFHNREMKVPKSHLKMVLGLASVHNQSC